MQIIDPLYCWLEVVEEVEVGVAAFSLVLAFEEDLLYCLLHGLPFSWTFHLHYLCFNYGHYFIMYFSLWLWILGTSFSSRNGCSLQQCC
jgi:hypothetical protein